MAHPLPILHVEDDPLDSLLLQEMLCSNEIGKNEYEVTSVTSLSDALGKLKKQGFSAVLLDLSLKDTNGTANIKAIRSQNPDVPIIVLTGFDSDQSAHDALNQGAQGYIVKSYGNSRTIHLAIQSSIVNKASEREFYKQAHFDDLTGLPNRRKFEEELLQAIERAKSWNRHETVIMLDIDNFKELNGRYGLEACNAILQDAARRLKVTLTEQDLVCRYGGDKFTILLSDGESDKKYACVKVLARIQDAFNKPFYWKDDLIKFTASMGVAFFPDSGADIATIMDNAAAATHLAKKEGGGHFKFAATV